MIYTQQNKKVTFIYPFASGEWEPPVGSPCLTVRPGSIYLDINRMALSPETAQALAEALLHAVEVSQRGRDGT